MNDERIDQVGRSAATAVCREAARRSATRPSPVALDRTARRRSMLSGAAVVVVILGLVAIALAASTGTRNAPVVGAGPGSTTAPSSSSPPSSASPSPSDDAVPVVIPGLPDGCRALTEVTARVPTSGLVGATLGPTVRAGVDERYDLGPLVQVAWDEDHIEGPWYVVGAVVFGPDGASLGYGLWLSPDQLATWAGSGGDLSEDFRGNPTAHPELTYVQTGNALAADVSVFREPYVEPPSEELVAAVTSCATQAAATHRVVPELVEQRLPDAQARLERIGLRNAAASGDDVNDPTGPETRVWAQEPPAGATVELGATVGLRTATFDVGADRTMGADPVG